MKYNIQNIINNKNINQKELNDLFLLLEESKNNYLFSFISTYYALKPWDVNDLRNVYNVLKNSNQIAQEPVNSITITATGGELNTRTLYITPLISFIVSVHKPVFLQGNTAISGCGCGNFAEADILKKLGIQIIDKPNAIETLEKFNFAFLFALNFHPLLKKYHGTRAELRYRDIFKVASTLADPPLSKNLFLCVYSEEQLKNCASILLERKTDHSIIVTGSEGIDEASLVGKTLLADIKGDKIEYFEFFPEDFGFQSNNNIINFESSKALVSECNQIINILKNKEKGPKFQLCILNAGIALYSANIVSSITDGIQLAQKTIESGDAYKKYLSLKKHV